MNKRKAKKAVKKKHNLKKYPKGLPPRIVDVYFSILKEELQKQLEEAILFGERA